MFSVVVVVSPPAAVLLVFSSHINETTCHSVSFCWRKFIFCFKAPDTRCITRATLRHDVACNVADDGHTVKQLRATISRVNTWYNFQVVRNVAGNVAPCFQAFKLLRDCGTVLQRFR